MTELSEPETSQPPENGACYSNSPAAGQVDVCLQNEIVPAFAFMQPGRIIAAPDDSGYDDYLELYPIGAGEIGVVGESVELESRLQRQRSSGALIFVSGPINCQSGDYGGCQIVVTDVKDILTAQGASWQVRPVRTMLGSVFTFSETEVLDNQLFFVQYARFPLVYSIGSVDEIVRDQLSQIANIGQLIAVNGDIGFSSQVRLPYLEVVSIDAQPDAQWHLSLGELDGLKNSMIDYFQK